MERKCVRSSGSIYEMSYDRGFRLQRAHFDRWGRNVYVDSGEIIVYSLHSPQCEQSTKVQNSTHSKSLLYTHLFSFVCKSFYNIFINIQKCNIKFITIHNLNYEGEENIGFCSVCIISYSFEQLATRN